MLEVGKTYKNDIGWEYTIITDQGKKPFNFVGRFGNSNSYRAFDKNGFISYAGEEAPKYRLKLTRTLWFNILEAKGSGRICTTEGFETEEEALAYAKRIMDSWESWKIIKTISVEIPV